MHISELDYDLPEELIAQAPARPRDSSRLLVLHRADGALEHRAFRDLPKYMVESDLVVLNDTKVVRGRLTGRRDPGGGKAEVLLLEEKEEGLWEALITPGRRLLPGRAIVFGDAELRAEVIARTPSGGRLLRFSGAADLSAAISRLGELPTPPYVHRPLDQETDYQTVYARAPGASAAPTAGLHFTSEMLEAVRARVREVISVTLHIGLGTFRPIRAELVEDHDMHQEWYDIPESAARTLSEALALGRRVLAVGTSTARALEAAWSGRPAPEQPASGAAKIREGSLIRPGAARTDLFILPGYRFRVVGALLTNFHRPRSTLLALICAFAGRDHVMRAYREAVAMRYRFLSFGDAMLII